MTVLSHCMPTGPSTGRGVCFWSLILCLCCICCNGTSAFLTDRVVVCCVIQVDLPVYPGERLSVKLVDVHVPTGYWRMAVQGMLDSPVTAARAAAALAEVAASGDEEGDMEELATGEEGEGEVGVVVEVDGLVSGEVEGVAAAVSATAAAAMAAGLVFGLDVSMAVVAPPVAAAAGL